MIEKELINILKLRNDFILYNVLKIMKQIQFDLECYINILKKTILMLN